jgi:hypothetical protein
MTKITHSIRVCVVACPVPCAEAMKREDDNGIDERSFRFLDRLAKRQ